jgi:hypothetical protein
MAAGSARAQDVPPTLRAVRVATPPVVDGALSEATWETGVAISDFRQREPEEGQPASEATTVRVLYDEVYLYIGAVLQDREPDRIYAKELRRDDDLGSDDTFAVLLDTYRDRRNAFLFRVNPRGTRFDAVVRNESSVDSDWDDQWTAEASRGPNGWSVEIAIPFKTLRFTPGTTQIWGVNFERVIRRKNEEAYWTNWSRDFEFIHVSQAGVLEGLEGIRQGQRIRIRPYVVAGGESLQATAPPRGPRALGEVGIDDLKIAVTPNLTADIAVNPDFAQTEIDEQRVNLTRFSLFFPEKRQFFIEGAESLRMGPPAGEPWDDQRDLELFHSRRIGLSDGGEPIPIVAGGKLTGKVRDVDLGVLAARTTEDEGQPAESFGVVRFRRELLRRSYVGAIATTRYGGGLSNTTLGADAQFVVWEHLRLGALAARTDDSRTTPAWARHLGASWEDDFLEIGASHLDIDPTFDPGIGFVRRNDRKTEANLTIGPRPSGGPVRQFEIGPGILFHHDDRGALLTRELSFGVETEFQSGDEFDVTFGNTREYLPEPFEIETGIVLPEGRYGWNGVSAGFRSFEGRRATVGVEVEVGGFYDGWRRSFEVSGDLRLGSHVNVQPEYEMNDVDLTEGAFRTHLFGLRSDLAINRDLLTSIFFQYNSDGDLAALQVRLNYIFRNIDNLYLVYNETRFTEGRFADRSNRSLVAKVTYSLHW